MRTGTLPALTVLIVVPLLAAAAWSAPIVKGQPTRSDVCGECHRDIYRMWAGSQHARAMEDPVFLDAYKGTLNSGGPTVARVCLGCHAPLGELVKDQDLKLKVTWEGVTCDFCHSIASVDTTTKTPKLVVDIGTVKRGPLKDAESAAHDVQYQPIHETVLACAPCHEFTNAEGTALMTTYSEWKGSSHAKANRVCQDCHMNRQEANVVDPVVSRVPDHEVNLHEVPGSHSIPMLGKALKVAFASHREGDSLVVEVRVLNKGAGHAVPTGMPGRRVLMDMSLTTGQGKHFTGARTYTKVFRDAAGQEIRLDSGFFGKGVALTSDSRIKADETRVERFAFAVPVNTWARANVKLHYEHAPTGNDDNRVWQTFFTQDFSIPAGGK